METQDKVEIRPELLRFAEAMEIVLRENDYKGSTSEGFRPDEMLERMWDEIRELDREAYGHPSILTTRRKLKTMGKEAVDVANFAMFFWLGCENWKTRDSEEA